MKDVKGYVERMEKSMQEKLFFIDKLDLENSIIVDFGCANGCLLEHIKAMKFKNVTLIGVEHNPEIAKMITAADEVYTDLLTVSTAIAVKRYSKDFRKVILITSSVLHELDDDTRSTLCIFAKCQVNYWVVRDMCYNNYGYVPTMELLSTIVEKSDPKQLASFIKHHTILNSSMVAEWLMKYPYVQNWEHEVKEYYWSTDWNMFTRAGGDIIYDNTYTNEFIAARIKRDYGIDINWSTHRQLIVKFK